MIDDSAPIEPPKSHTSRALGRAAAEGLVDLIPGASLLTNIYAVTHPPIEEVERQRWEHDITLRSNERDEKLRNVVGAFLRIKINHRRANDAQQLSFVRGGMISTLESIGRDGLTPALEAELHQKLKTTAGDVDEFLQGLDAALVSMSDDDKNREFVHILHDVVFGSFGKSSIRNDIDRLLWLRKCSPEMQKKLALDICGSIDAFNRGLTKLSNYATVSVDL